MARRKIWAQQQPVRRERKRGRGRAGRGPRGDLPYWEDPLWPTACPPTPDPTVGSGCSEPKLSRASCKTWGGGRPLATASSR
eukprot:3000912-Pyramimonas_sp.AAC.1